MIDGGAGTDAFNVTQTAAILIQTGVTVRNIETANFLSDGAVTLNTTAWTGLTALNPRRPPKVPHLWPPKLLHPAGGDLMH